MDIGRIGKHCQEKLSMTRVYSAQQPASNTWRRCHHRQSIPNHNTDIFQHQIGKDINALDGEIYEVICQLVRGSCFELTFRCYFQMQRISGTCYSGTWEAWTNTLPLQTDSTWLKAQLLRHQEPAAIHCQSHIVEACDIANN